MNRTMFIGSDLYYSQEFVNDRISELNECYKGIEQLNNIIHKAILELERYENDNEANRYAPVKETLDILRGNKQVEIIEDKKIEIIEDKKIEKIDVAWQNVFDEQVQQDCIKMILNKINEIIDKINKEDK